MDLGRRNREDGPVKRDQDCARWRLDGGHIGLAFATASMVRAGREIICMENRGQGSARLSRRAAFGYLRLPAVGPTAFGSGNER